MIRYIPKSPAELLPISVYLDDRYVGRIVEANGFQYVAKGGHKGEVFGSIEEVKASLEGAD